MASNDLEFLTLICTTIDMLIFMGFLMIIEISKAHHVSTIPVLYNSWLPSTQNYKK